MQIWTLYIKFIFLFSSNKQFKTKYVQSNLEGNPGTAIQNVTGLDGLIWPNRVRRVLDWYRRQNTIVTLGFGSDTAMDTSLSSFGNEFLDLTFLRVLVVSGAVSFSTRMEAIFSVNPESNSTSFRLLRSNQLRSRFFQLLEVWIKVFILNYLWHRPLMRMPDLESYLIFKSSLPLLGI